MPKSNPDMSSKRKSQPTRIRDQENELSPAQSPDMATEKGIRQKMIKAYNSLNTLNKTIKHFINVAQITNF